MFSKLDQFLDREALIIKGSQSITYSELVYSGDKLGGKVPPRSLIINLCTNTTESIIGYVGFMRRDAVQLLVDETIDPEFLSCLINIYSPQYVYLPAVSSYQELGGKVVHSFQAYNLVALNPPKAGDIHPKLALLLTTSGTTGNPKLVRISYDNLKANTHAIIESLRLRADDRAITTMPMSYSYGLSILNTHLALGASVVLTTASVMSREFWTILKENSVTNFGGVPYFYDMLKKLKFRNLTLPHLRFITQAGGKLSSVLAEDFREICINKSIQFFVMYGQTEATARMSCICLTDYLDKTGSIGQAIPNGEFWLIDNEGNTITSHNSCGELVYQGPNVSLGFASCLNDLASGDEFNGRLQTGDLATKDQDGFIYILGRKKHFLKIFGMRINLTDVEDILKSQGYDCACAGSDDKLLIFVTKINNQEKILSIIADKTGINKSGFRVVEIDKIPRSESGKILYSTLQSIAG
jgi:long-chain acyl-CoA synthetase